MLNEVLLVQSGGNPVRQKSYAFALEVIELNRCLRAKRELVLSNQLLRAGTSIGANVEEAQAAQTHKDFVAKMSIAAKEARETRYWLCLLRDGHLAPVDLTQPIAHVEELIRLLTAIVKTAGERV